MSSTANIQKLPSITLSISYRGVSFRDSTTAIAICDHEVRIIHCAAQDNDDLRFLAYITKDIHVNKHFCHVFRTDAMVSAHQRFASSSSAASSYSLRLLRLSFGYTRIPPRVDNVELTVDESD